MKKTGKALQLIQSDVILGAGVSEKDGQGSTVDPE